MGEKSKKKKYQLDVSSQFYPIIATRKSQSIFGLTAHMDAMVDPMVLQSAVNEVLKRFPTFAVRLRRGYAWYYFEENNAVYKVEEAKDVPLLPISRKEKDGYLFRINCKKDVIIFEVFHAICDGLAAIEFFKAVLYVYALKTKKEEISPVGVIDINAEPTSEEAEDAFYRHHTRIKLGDVELKELMGSRIAMLPGELLNEKSAVSYGTVPVDELRESAKVIGVSITAFLAGAVALAIHKEKGCENHDIAIMVPVNLREMFPSTTLRNFVNFVRILFKRGECETLEDYAKSASEQLKEKATREAMIRFMSTTVSMERSLILKVAPLWLKIFFARIVRIIIKSRQTLIISNLGRVSFPENAGVQKMFFNLNVSKTSRVNIGTLSFGGEAMIAFSRSIKERSLEERFFSILADYNICRLQSGDSLTESGGAKEENFSTKAIPVLSE